MNRKMIGILIGANILLLAALGWRLHVGRNEVRRQMDEISRTEDNDYAESGVLRPGEFQRLMLLADSTHETKKISNADLDWTIAAMKTTESKQNALNVGSARGFISLVWGNVQEPTVEQSVRLGQAAVEVLRRAPANSDNADVANSLRVLSCLRDQRALPEIRRFVESPDQAVQSWAREALRRTGGVPNRARA